MDFDILDSIYWEYHDYCLGSDIKEEAKDTIAFKKEYIVPVLEENSDKGREMDSAFNKALAECDIDAFKRGFRVCMHIVIDYLKGEK